MFGPCIRLNACSMLRQTILKGIHIVRKHAGIKKVKAHPSARSRSLLRSSSTPLPTPCHRPLNKRACGIFRRENTKLARQSYPNASRRPLPRFCRHAALRVAALRCLARCGIPSEARPSTWRRHSPRSCGHRQHLLVSLKRWRGK